MSFYYKDEQTNEIKRKIAKKTETVVIPEQEMLQIKGKIEDEMKVELQKEMRAAMFNIRESISSSKHSAVAVQNPAELTFNKTDLNTYKDYQHDDDNLPGEFLTVSNGSRLDGASYLDTL